ncbi:FMRFamide receptor-like [Crassostrea virginica]
MDNSTWISTGTSSSLIDIMATNLTHSSLTFANSTENTSSPLKSASFDQLRLTRLVVQKFLVPIITCAGVVGNVVSIAVLTHKSMKTSTNRYLTALAIFDMLYLVTSMILSLNHYKEISEKKFFQYFYLYSVVFVDIWSNISVCLTVTFTVERYVGVCHPMKGRAICTPKRAQIITCCVILFVIIATSPEFLGREVYEEVNLGVTTHRIRYTSIGESKGYAVFYSWFIVLMFTFIPLTALLSFNIILIRSVCKANRIRRQMTYVAVNRPGETNSGEQTKITCMLISVAFVFILCQLPTAATICFNTYVELSGKTLTRSEGNYLRIAGNVSNILISVNAAVNFILYSVMSTKFRKVFLRMFCKKSKYTMRKSLSEYSYSTGVSSLRRMSSGRGLDGKRLGYSSHSPERLIKHCRPLSRIRHHSQESLTSKDPIPHCFSKRPYTDTVL